MYQDQGQISSSQGLSLYRRTLSEILLNFTSIMMSSYNEMPMPYSAASIFSQCSNDILDPEGLLLSERSETG